MALLKVDNCLQAESDCTVAIQLDPQNAKAFHRRGLAREKLGDLNGAAEDFKKALSLMNDDSIAKNLAQIQELIKNRDSEHQNEEERKKTEKGKQKQKIDVEAERNEAKELFQTGQFPLTVEKYSLILQEGDISDENRVLFLNNRAACYIQMKFENEALSDLRQVLDIDPYNVKARLRRALVYENMEKFGLAYDDYKLVIAMDPASAAKASEGVRRLLQNNPELKSRPTPEMPEVPSRLSKSDNGQTERNDQPEADEAKTKKKPKKK